MGGCASSDREAGRDNGDCRVLKNKWVDESSSPKFPITNCLNDCDLGTLFGLSRNDCMGEGLKLNLVNGSLSR